MGFLLSGGGGGGSSGIGIHTGNLPPQDTTKIWLDTSSTDPVWKKYDITSGTWKAINVIGDGDINDNVVAPDHTWSSEQILEKGSFTYEKVSPSEVWEIEHPLHRMPSVTCIDDTGEEMEGDVSFDSIDKITITFSQPVAGKAFLN
jgi:hypothetical protein